jgi:hypothetical protein
VRESCVFLHVKAKLERGTELLPCSSLTRWRAVSVTPTFVHPIIAHHIIINIIQPLTHSHIIIDVVTTARVHGLSRYRAPRRWQFHLNLAHHCSYTPHRRIVGVVQSLASTPSQTVRDSASGKLPSQSTPLPPR